MANKSSGTAKPGPVSNANTTPHHHEHHQAVLNRLARIEGHVRAVRRMVEQDTPCPEVLVQLAAVRSALNSVGRVILEDHLQSCMVEAAQEGDYHEALRDLKNSLDKFIG
ncbi:MAG: metal-sensing transcriptional repressor [Chloroflexi bacterium]|nr:metal-sensing transcriptional repressor [Chloroflexota bacterium]